MDDFKEVIKSGMCIGCGYCSSFSDGRMKLNEEGFLEPESQSILNIAESNRKLINKSCPGINGKNVSTKTSTEKQGDTFWGRHLYVGTAYSTDELIRHSGSSGGVITGICSWLLKSGRVDSVLNTSYSNDNPIATKSIHATNDGEILAGAGSKYSPSSPLAVLNQIRGKKGKYAIVARPCDIATLRRALNSNDEIGESHVILISFFCAGTPSENANEKLLSRIGVSSIKDVVSFRHRGNGWPGFTTATMNDGSQKQCTYNEAWGGVLRSQTNDLCKVCADGIGEEADIVAADAWYGDESGYPDFNEKDGRSLLLGRTNLGLLTINDAINDNVIKSNTLEVREIDAMQPGQLNRRMQLRMRLLAYKVMGRKVPQYNVEALKQYEKGMSKINRVKVFIKTIKKLW